MAESKGRLKFLEVEHKFVVSSTFDRSIFFRRVRALKPKREAKVSVKDRYYLLRERRDLVFRHRLDREIQQLTVKSLQGPIEARLEINLHLGHEHGNQHDAIKALLSAIGPMWSGVIAKQVYVFEFRDCEVVYYSARCGQHVIYCVEFEATKKTSRKAAVEILNRYEKKLGFDPRGRSTKSLFEMLLLPASRNQKKNKRKSP